MITQVKHFGIYMANRDNPIYEKGIEFPEETRLRTEPVFLRQIAYQNRKS